MAGGKLTLVCRKCTREGHFTAATVAQAAEQAAKAGWMLIGYGPRVEDVQYACPKCPAYPARSAA